MATFADHDPSKLKPSWVDKNGDLKPSLVTNLYVGGTPTAANQVKPSLIYPDGRLREGIANELGLKRSLLKPVTATLENRPLFTSMAFLSWADEIVEAKKAPTQWNPIHRFYISNSLGDDSNPGTIAEPWKTIAKVQSDLAKRINGGLNSDSAELSLVRFSFTCSIL